MRNDCGHSAYENGHSIGTSEWPLHAKNTKSKVSEKESVTSERARSRRSVSLFRLLFGLFSTQFLVCEFEETLEFLNFRLSWLNIV